MKYEEKVTILHNFALVRIRNIKKKNLGIFKILNRPYCIFSQQMVKNGLIFK